MYESTIEHRRFAGPLRPKTHHRELRLSGSFPETALSTTSSQVKLSFEARMASDNPFSFRIRTNVISRSMGTSISLRCLPGLLSAGDCRANCSSRE